MKLSESIYSIILLSVLLGSANSFFLWKINRNPPTEASLLFKVFKSSSIVKIHRNQESGKYYVNMYTGTPRQKISVVLDTTSDKTYIKCKHLNNNKAVDNSLFNYNASASYKPLECGGRFLKFYCDKKSMCNNNQCVSSVVTNSNRQFETKCLMEQVGFKVPIDIQLGENIPIKKENQQKYMKLLKNLRQVKTTENKDIAALQAKYQPIAAQRRRLINIISYKTLKKNDKELAILKRILLYSESYGFPSEQAVLNCIEDDQF